MTTPAWPSTLPQLPLHDGYSEQFGATFIRSETEAGPAKRRKKISFAPRPMVYPIFLETFAEVALLETFYYDTLGGGALSFTHDHPRTGTAGTVFAFKSPPELTPMGLGFLATLELEIVQ
jgi:hypothetical protein